MIKKLLCITIIMLVVKTKAQQNLVPNGSFESYTTCPNSTSQITYASFWLNPSLHSPDYFNACSTGSLYNVSSNYFGSQNARTGSAYAGVGIACYNGTREYISVMLLDSLAPAKTYYLEFHVSLSDSSNYSTHNLGAYFSKTEINDATTDSLNYTPQVKNSSGNYLSDKNNWFKIKGYFKGQNYEKYLVIGNFNGFKTTDSIFIGNGGIGTNPNYNGAYYYIDDVFLADSSTVGIEENPESVLSVQLLQNKDYLEINCSDYFTLELFDLYGKSIVLSNNLYKNHATLFLDNYIKGIYILKIKTKYITKTFKIII